MLKMLVVTWIRSGSEGALAAFLLPGTWWWENSLDMTELSRWLVHLQCGTWSWRMWCRPIFTFRRNNLPDVFFRCCLLFLFGSYSSIRFIRIYHHGSLCHSLWLWSYANLRRAHENEVDETSSTEGPKILKCLYCKNPVKKLNKYQQFF